MLEGGRSTGSFIREVSYMYGGASAWNFETMIVRTFYELGGAHVGLHGDNKLHKVQAALSIMIESSQPSGSCRILI
jgi:hypothetical protein